MGRAAHIVERAIPGFVLCNILGSIIKLGSAAELHSKILNTLHVASTQKPWVTGTYILQNQIINKLPSWRKCDEPRWRKCDEYIDDPMLMYSTENGRWAIVFEDKFRKAVKKKRTIAGHDMLTHHHHYTFPPHVMDWGILAGDQFIHIEGFQIEASGANETNAAGASEFSDSLPAIDLTLELESFSQEWRDAAEGKELQTEVDIQFSDICYTISLLALSIVVSMLFTRPEDVNGQISCFLSNFKSATKQLSKVPLAEDQWVSCPLQCGIFISRKSVKAHLKQCCKRSIKCRFCGESMPEEDFVNHEFFKCKNLLTICSWCGDEMPRGQLWRHEETCLGPVLQCVCGHRAREGQFHEHLWMCDLMMTSCPYCFADVSQRDMVVHLCPTVTSTSTCVVCHNSFAEAEPCVLTKDKKRVCGHVQLCLTCASNIAKKGNSSCPLCRARFDSVNALPSHLVVPDDSQVNIELLMKEYELMASGHWELSIGRQRRQCWKQFVNRAWHDEPPCVSEVLWLAPTQIRFTHDAISYHFKNGKPILDTVSQIVAEKWRINSIPKVEVVWHPSECTFYVAGTFNRRLCVFRLISIFAPHVLRRIKVRVADINDSKVNFKGMKSTTCSGKRVFIRRGPRAEWPEVGSTRDSTHWLEAEQLFSRLATLYPQV